MRLTADVRIRGTDTALPYGKLPDYRHARIQNIPDWEFEALLGRPIPDGGWSGELTRNDAICQLYYAKTGLARLVCKLLTSRKAAKAFVQELEKGGEKER